MALTQRLPHARVLVLEKESSVALHQTGHNSGVIHSGIYYKPGSLKARYAREGNQSMVEFCETHGIEHEVCGKVIVATESSELPGLKNLYQRGIANGLSVKEIDPVELKEIEPHVKGIAALHISSTGIVNYRKVAEVFARLIQKNGGDLRLNTRVMFLAEDEKGVHIESNNGTFQAKSLINCSGLYSDRVAGLGHLKTGMKIIPFRGEYFELKPERRHLVKHLIYPVPDPKFPFLGVHFTRIIGGGIHAGPNAVLALKREGYHKFSFNLRDCLDIISYSAFWKFAIRNLGYGAMEMIRSVSKTAFVRSLQKLIPEIQPDDIVPSPSGVRAQALMADGRLMDDFLIIKGRKSVHVCNAPSPAATASIVIGQAIADELAV
jgi:L-2-hydroxyglutarate oxidase